MDASRTWALVVGIDEYKDAGIPALTGAAADAVAVVRWLLRLGVPKDQVLLHTAARPATQPDVAALGLPKAVQDASFDAIDDSIVNLAKESGDRLYVFLSGHAVYEPSEAQLFLCSDFGESGSRTAKTLGIDALARHLLTLRFPEQFLFVDGCQNLPYSSGTRKRFPIRTRRVRGHPRRGE